MRPFALEESSLSIGRVKHNSIIYLMISCRLGFRWTLLLQIIFGKIYVLKDIGEIQTGLDDLGAPGMNGSLRENEAGCYNTWKA